MEQTALTIEEITDPDKLSDDEAQQVIELVLEIFRGNPNFAKFLDRAESILGTPDQFRQNYMKGANGTVFTARKATSEKIRGVLCASLRQREVLETPEMKAFDLDRLLYIDYSSVSPTAQQRGLFTVLFNAFWDRAKNFATTQPDGQANVFLNIHPDNNRSVIELMFARRGFAPIGDVGTLREDLLVMRRIATHL